MGKWSAAEGRAPVRTRFLRDPRTSPTAKALISSAGKINTIRNAVVHQGSFSNKDEAEAVIAEAKTFINMIVGLSIDGFDIDAQAASVRATAPADGTPE